jgi:hypothetical protein
MEGNCTVAAGQKERALVVVLELQGTSLAVAHKPLENPSAGMVVPASNLLQCTTWRDQKWHYNRMKHDTTHVPRKPIQHSSH